MSFWAIVLVAIVVLGWLDQFRTGRRDGVEPTSKKAPLRKGSSPLPVASGVGESEVIAPPRSVLCGVNQALDTINIGIAKRLEVEKATKQLQGDVDRERILIDGAFKIAQTRFRTEEVRRQMSSTQRQTYDLTAQRLAAAFAAKDADQGEQAVEYRRPIFSFPEGSYSDEVALAIREKIGALQEERATYVAAINHRISGTELGRYFVEAFERLGGASNRAVAKNAPADRKRDDRCRRWHRAISRTRRRRTFGPDRTSGR